MDLSNTNLECTKSTRSLSLHHLGKSLTLVIHRPLEIHPQYFHMSVPGVTHRIMRISLSKLSQRKEAYLPQPMAQYFLIWEPRLKTLTSRTYRWRPSTSIQQNKAVSEKCRRMATVLHAHCSVGKTDIEAAQNSKPVTRITTSALRFPLGDNADVVEKGFRY